MVAPGWGTYRAIQTQLQRPSEGAGEETLSNDRCYPSGRRAFVLYSPSMRNVLVFEKSKCQHCPEKFHRFIYNRRKAELLKLVHRNADLH